MLSDRGGQWGSRKRGATPVIWRYRLQQGMSMSPTLQEGDLLEIAVGGNRPVCPGDVITFRHPVEGDIIAHRLIATTPTGMITQGDGNDAADPFLLTPDQVEGRVMVLWRSGNRRRVAGGWRGRLVRLLAGCQRTAAGKWPRRLAFRRWPGWLRPQMIAYQCFGNYWFHLTIGGIVIGRMDGRIGKWRLRRGIRLLLDPTALPAIGPEKGRCPAPLPNEGGRGVSGPPEII